MALALQLWVWAATTVIVLATLRRWQFTWNRSSARQRPGFSGLIDSEPPRVSAILAPAGAAGARLLIDALLASTYPLTRLEILCIDTGTNDSARAIVEAAAAGAPAVRWIAARDAEPAAATLERAVRGAANDIALVFDGDTLPGPDVVRGMALPFVDPEVGAVSGRVLARNAAATTLTRLLALARSGAGLERQARYNLGRFPLRGAGTTAYRRAALAAAGIGAPASVLVRLRLAGWSVLYAHRAESFADVPDSWDALARCTRASARDGARAAVAQIVPLLRSTTLRGGEKLDAAALLLGGFAAPLGLSVVLAAALLVALGALPVVPAVVFAFCFANASAVGGAAPVFSAGAADLIEGRQQRLLLLPALCWLALFESWAATLGVLDALWSGA